MLHYSRVYLLISFKALLDAIKRCVIVFRSSGVGNSLANLYQSRLIDARSALIIHKSFSLLVIVYRKVRSDAAKES